MTFHCRALHGAFTGLAALALGAGAIGETKTCEFRGATLVYDLHEPDAADDRAPIVLVHGWASSRTFWHKQIDALSENRRVLAIDLPGHGESEDVADEHSMDLYADAIAGAMDDAGIEQAVIVGHSNGVPTVRQFYRRFAPRVVAFVGIDGAFANLMPAEMAKGFLETFKGENYKATATQMFGALASQMADPEDAAHIRGVMLSTPQRVMVGALEAGMDPAIWIDDDIERPLLILNAVNPFWSDEYNARLQTLSGDVVVEVWPGVSHFLFMDEPEKFNSAVLRFLDERGL